MTSNQIYLKLKSYFEDTALPKVKSFTGALGAQMSKAGAAIAGVNAMFGQMPGKIGAAINGVGRLATAAMTMGPVGVVVTGASLAFQWMQDRAQKAAQAIEAGAKKMAEAVKTRCAEIKYAVEARVAKPLEDATTNADKAAKAFNSLASAYLKVAAAKDATAKAGDDVEIAKLRQGKVEAMAKASEGDAAISGAGFDVKIAEAQAKATAAAHDRAVRQADDEAAVAQKRLSLANDKEAKAKEALATAMAEEARAREEITPNDGGEWEKRMRAIREKAEKALFDAQQQRIAAEADNATAAEKLKQAQLNQSAALADASAAVTGAKDSLRKLEQARADAARAEMEAAEEKAKKDAEAARRDGLNAAAGGIRKDLGDQQGALAEANAKVNAAEQAKANAWALYKSPEAMRAQLEQEREEEKLQKRFQRDADRLQKRKDWRTAKLGRKDEATRRMLLAQEAEEQAKVEQQQLKREVEASRRNLDAIAMCLDQQTAL